MLLSNIAFLLKEKKVSNKFLRNLVIICLPLNLTVSVIYWTLVLFFRDLILIDNIRIPIFIDCLLHALPAITSVIQAKTMKHKRVKFFSSHLIKYISIGLGYIAYIEYRESQSLVYAYPFLNMASTPSRILIYISSILVSWSLFILFNRFI